MSSFDDLDDEKINSFANNDKSGVDAARSAMNEGGGGDAAKAAEDSVTEKVKAAEDNDDECTKCIQTCREKGFPAGGMSMGGTGMLFVLVALLLTVFVTPLFDRGKSLFVATILCDESRPSRGMRWPTGLSMSEYAWLLYHNVMSSIPFVNVAYALGLTFYYRKRTACLMHSGDGGVVAAVAPIMD